MGSRSRSRRGSGSGGVRRIKGFARAARRPLEFMGWEVGGMRYGRGVGVGGVGVTVGVGWGDLPPWITLSTAASLRAASLLARRGALAWARPEAESRWRRLATGAMLQDAFHAAAVPPGLPAPVPSWAVVVCQARRGPRAGGGGGRRGRRRRLLLRQAAPVPGAVEVIGAVLVAVAARPHEASAGARVAGEPNNGEGRDRSGPG